MPTHELHHCSYITSLNLQHILKQVWSKHLKSHLNNYLVPYSRICVMALKQWSYIWYGRWIPNGKSQSNRHSKSKAISQPVKNCCRLVQLHFLKQNLHMCLTFRVSDFLGSPGSVMLKILIILTNVRRGSSVQNCQRNCVKTWRSVYNKIICK